MTPEQQINEHLEKAKLYSAIGFLVYAGLEFSKACELSLKIKGVK